MKTAILHTNGMEFPRPTEANKATLAAFLLVAGGLVAVDADHSSERSLFPTDGTLDPTPPVIDEYAVEGDEVIVPPVPALAKKK